MKKLYFLYLIILLPFKSMADTCYIATASNFYLTLKIIINTIDTAQYKISSGSSGKIFAQIMNKAPYDIFFSADQKRVNMLPESIKYDQKTYAYGKIVVWDKNVNSDFNKQLAIKKIADSKKITLANPKLAPYGNAAYEFLQTLKLDKKVGRYVYGENINQTLNFVKSGSVKVGIVSLAQIIQLKNEKKFQGGVWIVDDNLYSPIVQDVALLKSGSQKKSCDTIWKLLSEKKIKKLIKDTGYDVY